MLGQIDRNIRQADVFGGGISGLIAAYFAAKAGYRVTLYEKSSRLGGLIATQQTPYGLAESAATSIRANDCVREFCANLGINLLNADPKASARFIVRNKRLQRFPLQIHELIGMGLRTLFRRAISHDHELSLGAWSAHHLGQAATDYLLNPFTTGIYAADPYELDLDATYPQLRCRDGHSLITDRLRRRVFNRDHIKKHDTIRMTAPAGGMQEIIDKLATYLNQHPQVTMKLSTDASIRSDANTILCVPAPAAALLLNKAAPTTSTALHKIRYAPMVSVTVFARPQTPAQNPPGVGFLVPARENLNMLGVLYTSATFSGRNDNNSNIAVFTIMLGGTRHPEVISWDDARITTVVQESLRLIHDTTWEIPMQIIHRWPQAIPVYERNLRDTWSIATQDWCAQPGNIICGNYTGELAIRSMIESWTQTVL